MIQRLNQVTFNYQNPILQQRAASLIITNWAALTGFILAYILRPLPQIFAGQQGLGAIVNPFNIFGLVVYAVIYILIQRGRLYTAIYLFLAYILFLFVPILLTSFDNPITYLLALLPVVAAGLMLNRRGLFIMLAIMSVVLIARYLVQNNMLTTVRYVPGEMAFDELQVALLIFVLAALYLFAFSGSMERFARTSLDDLRQIRTVLHFGDQLGAAPTETTLYTHLLEVAQTDLRYELAQLYLPDEDGRFSRQLRLSFAGVPRRVTITDSDQDIIRAAIRDRQPVLVSWRDNSFRTEHLIPPSRQSFTYALVDRDAVIAVLDVQTESAKLLTPNEVEALVLLARQTVRELGYARALREAQSASRDQEAVVARLTRQLSEIQGRARQVSVQGWGRYFQGRGSEAFGFDLTSENGRLLPIDSSDLPPEIRETIMRGDVYVDQSGGEHRVSVPIRFRDLVLGAMSFTLPADRPIADRQIDLLRTVADRLSVALENNRLLEQTQAQAARERQASEISTLLLSATNVETVLNLAAQSFNEALGAVNTRVYLQPGALIKSGAES